MKNFIFLCLTITLVGCGENYDPDIGHVDINKDFQAYVNRFAQVARADNQNVEINNIVIEYDEKMASNILGICYYSRVRRVTINPRFWNSRYTSNAGREQLMFHELGHCLMGRGHNDQELVSQDGYRMPASIMNSYFFSPSWYAGNLNYYLGELFYRDQPVVLYANAVSTFPAEYYASTVAEGTTFASKLESVSDESFDETMYQDLSHFGCGEESHNH